MDDTQKNSPQPPEVASDQIAGWVLEVGQKMLVALDAAGLSPFRGPEYLTVLQLLGPVCTRIVGGDPAENYQEVIDLAKALDLSGLQDWRL